MRTTSAHRRSLRWSRGPAESLTPLRKRRTDGFASAPGAANCRSSFRPLGVAAHTSPHGLSNHSGHAVLAGHRRRDSRRGLETAAVRRPMARGTGRVPPALGHFLPRPTADDARAAGGIRQTLRPVAHPPRRAAHGRTPRGVRHPRAQGLEDRQRRVLAFGRLVRCRAAAGLDPPDPSAPPVRRRHALREHVRGVRRPLAADEAVSRRVSMRCTNRSTSTAAATPTAA